MTINTTHVQTPRHLIATSVLLSFLWWSYNSLFLGAASHLKPGRIFTSLSIYLAAVTLPNIVQSLGVHSLIHAWISVVIYIIIVIHFVYIFTSIGSCRDSFPILFVSNWVGWGSVVSSALLTKSPEFISGNCGCGQYPQQKAEGTTLS